MMLSLGARCCCNCRSLAVLVMLSLGNLTLAFAVCCRSLAVLVLSTAAATAVLASAVYCRSLAVLVLSTATTAVHSLSLSWRCNLVMFAFAAAVAHLLSW
ncbi:hypothetical protein MAM1_0123d05929 [Mucor ambiguus]|uniref:Uncharacterized protein n=1 Tax=Mucor ambiguus TaxID=91626 RepID=A0A0C9M828_9FUNG|nr:hypothetical protein MAM1_0123d05929 [Mucor ambiguus]